MTFHHVTPNAEYRTLRLHSDGGNWELGMSPYSHGMRMRMGQTGYPPRVMDFCMGNDGALFPNLLVAILNRLKPLADSSTASEIDQVFPWAGTRPDLALHLDLLLSITRHEQPTSNPT
jgi:hypothetical protein